MGRTEAKSLGQTTSDGFYAATFPSPERASQNQHSEEDGGPLISSSSAVDFCMMGDPRLHFCQ